MPMPPVCGNSALTSFSRQHRCNDLFLFLSHTSAVAIGRHVTGTAEETADTRECRYNIILAFSYSCSLTPGLGRRGAGMHELVFERNYQPRALVLSATVCVCVCVCVCVYG